MSEDERGIMEKAATAIIRAALFFIAGFVVAQMPPVQHALTAAMSHEGRSELLQYTSDAVDKGITTWSTKPHALKGGAVLLGIKFSTGLALLLVGEDGHILHRWTAENRIFNPDILTWWGTVTTRKGFSVDDAQLLPQGDVILIQVQMDVNNFRGQRLVRLDSESHVVWQVPGNFHHLIDLAGNPQSIYTTTSRLVTALPEVGPPIKNVGYMEDWVEVYTMDGKKTHEWSIIDAFARSPYRTWLTSFEIDIPDLQRINIPRGHILYDLFHLNSVQYLDAMKAKALPGAQEGDLLLSLRGLNALAVFRPKTGTIVWAGKGPWRHQHNARVDDDGKLYIFDNEGRQVIKPDAWAQAKEELQTRVIRYNPYNGQMEEIFASPQLNSFYLGNYQQLADGSWLICSPQRSRIFLLSADKSIDWEMRTVPNLAVEDVPLGKQISMMHYYPASALSFLNVPQRVSP
jgi:hypothetical protein